VTSAAVVTLSDMTDDSTPARSAEQIVQTLLNTIDELKRNRIG
jgi:hypothetical protein